MKRKYFIHALFCSLALGFSYCNPSNDKKSDNPHQKKQIVENEILSSGATSKPTFELKTIPLGNEYRNEIIYFKHTDQPKNSLLVFLDPQGIGRKPLKKYKGLYLEHYDVMASNFSRNGVELIEVAKHIKRALLAVKKYQKVTLIGFSGGGRQAFFTAYSLFNEHPEISVISCGSGMHNPRFKADIGFEYRIIMGLKDFNFAEIVSLVKQRNLKVFTGDFGHDWPADSILNLAIKSELHEPHFALKNEQLSNKEMQENSRIQLNLPDKPLPWWQNYIQSLKSLNETKNEAFYKSQRQLAYLEFVAYLYTKKSMSIAAETEINKGLNIMKLINNNNPDIDVLSAKKAIIDNNPTKAIEHLQMAVEKGFVNQYSLFEDPFFQKLQGEALFANIIAQIEIKLALP